MAGFAYQFETVEPALLTNMGSHLDNPAAFTPSQESTPRDYISFLNYGRQQQDFPTQYAFRQPFDPPLTTTPPCSPTRRALDPTARPFTPRQPSPSHLRVDTNVKREPTTPQEKTPVTPRIEVSPAEDSDLGAAVQRTQQDSRLEEFQQHTRTRRESSPGRRPTALRTGSRAHPRRTPMAGPAPSMLRGDSAPGMLAGGLTAQDHTPPALQSCTPPQRPQNLVTPVRSTSGRRQVMGPPPIPVPMEKFGSPAAHVHRNPLQVPQTPVRQQALATFVPAEPIRTDDWLTGTANVGYAAWLHQSRELDSPFEPATPGPSTPASVSAADQRNWAAPSPSASSVVTSVDYANTPRSECSYGISGPSTPMSSFGSASRPRATSRRSPSARSRGSIVCTFDGHCNHRQSGKTFKTPGELRKHEKTHWPKSRWPLGCDHCTERFLWPKDRKRHIEVVHEGARVKCEHCDQTLCRGDDLYRHVATLHGVAQPFASYGSLDVPGSVPMEKSRTR